MTESNQQSISSEEFWALARQRKEPLPQGVADEIARQPNEELDRIGRAGIVLDFGIRDEYIEEILGPPTVVDGEEFWSYTHLKEVLRTVVAPAVVLIHKKIDLSTLEGQNNGPDVAFYEDMIEGRNRLLWTEQEKTADLQARGVI